MHAARVAFVLAMVVTGAAGASDVVPSPLNDQPLSPALSPQGRGSKAAWAVSAVGACLVSGAAAFGAGALLQDASFQAAGRPDPVVFAAALAIGMGVNMLITSFVLPELARFANSEEWKGDVAVSRRTAWGLARWAALGAAAGVLTFGAGGFLDRADYGKGQGLMIVGGLAFLVSFIVWDVLDAVGAWSGMVGSQTRR